MVQKTSIRGGEREAAREQITPSENKKVQMRETKHKRERKKERDREKGEETGESRRQKRWRGTVRNIV